MKRQKAWKLKTGVAIVAALSLGVTLNRITASSEDGPSPNTQLSTDTTTENGEPSPSVGALTPPPLDVSPGMEEIIQMARSGVTQDVLTAFIENSGKRYQPSPDEIIYLRDLGVANEAIAALIRSVKTGGDPPINANVPEVTGNQRDDAEVSVSKEDGNTTVNVTTHNHYAAAPQSQQPADLDTVTGGQSNADAPVDLSHFKRSLSPYGSWIFVDGVGECWRPTIAAVNSTWRPYYDGGRWIYSDAGWYWLSDYSWGWAPFHYGRWHMSASFGWVWAPGYTWGPAWVSWRRTPTYCGWAPLPAYSWGVGYGHYGRGWSFSFGISWGNYNWVPNRYCYGYYPRYYAAPYAVKQEIYNNSTVIKPTIIGDNNTVIINGPDATMISQASSIDVRRVTLRDATNPRTQGPRDYLENGGETLATYRPTISSVSRPEMARTNGGAETGTRPSVSGRSNPAGTAPSISLARDSRNGGPITRSVETRSSSRPTVQAERRALPARPTTNPETARRATTTSTSPARIATTRTSGEQPTASRTPSSRVTSPRTSGQNTTISRSPNYTTPAARSTPILRNGRTIQYNPAARVSAPVISGGVRTQSPRSSYPGSTAVSSSRQTVRTPSYTRPSTSSQPSFTPSRSTSSSYSTSSSSRTPTSRSYAPTTTRPSSVTPSRSYTPSSSTRIRVQPSTQRSTPTFTRPSPSYSRPTVAPTRPSVSPSRSTAPSSSRIRSTPVSRAPSVSPSRASSASRATISPRSSSPR